MPKHSSIPDDAERFRILEKMYLQRERELAAVRCISEALSQRMKLQDLIEQALRTALDVLNAENGSLLLADADRERLVFCYSIGDKPVPLGTVIPWTRGIAGAVFQSCNAEIVREAQKDPRYLTEIDLLCGSVTHDMITIPLKKWDGDPIGVVQVMNKRRGQLDEQDVGVLTIFARYLPWPSNRPDCLNIRNVLNWRRIEVERSRQATELHDHLGPLAARSHAFFSMKSTRSYYLACCFIPGMAPMLLQLRPLNEALLRARVPGA